MTNQWYADKVMLVEMDPWSFEALLFGQTSKALTSLKELLLEKNYDTELRKNNNENQKERKRCIQLRGTNERLNFVIYIKK